MIAAAVFLACAGSAAATDPAAPSAEPLWKAYPLDTGRSTTTPHPPAQRASTTSGPSVRLDPPGDVAPLGIVIVFYAAIAGMLLCVAELARRRVRRRRSVRSRRSAPPPTGPLRG